MIRKIWTHLYKNHTHEQLVEIIKANNALSSDQAFSALYSRLSTDLFTYLYYITLKREIAEELTNETFISFHQNISRYDHSRSVKPWIWRIGRNKAFNYLKKHRESLFEDFSREQELDPIQSIEDEKCDNQLEILILCEKKKRIEKYIMEIRPTQREALLLWLEGYEFGIIAELIDKSPQAVKNLIHRGKKELTKLLQKQKEEL